MKCPNCGSEVLEDDVFCDKCGEKITHNADENASSASPEGTEAEKEAVSDNASEKDEKPETAEKTEEKPEEKTEEKKEKADTEKPEPAEKQEEQKDEAPSADSDTSEPAGSGEKTDIAETFAKLGEQGAAALGKVPKNALIGAAIGVAAVILLILIFALSSSSSNGDYITASNTVPTVITGRDAVYVFNGTKQISKTDIDDAYVNYDNSFDGSSKCIYIYEYDSQDNDLYYTTVSETAHIASDIDGYQFAPSGNAVAYYSDDTLYLYTVSSKKNEKIANDVERFVISPDGKTVVYADEDGVCHIYSSGKTTDFDGKDITPVAVADNAKYFYYLKNGSFYVYNGKDSVKLSTDGFNGVLFNKDATEALFSVDGKVYISVKGAEKQKISGVSSVRVRLPQDSRTSSSGGYSSSFYPFSTFDKKVITDENSAIKYLIAGKDDWSAEKIASNVDQVLVSNNGKKVVYLKNSKIFTVNNFLKKSDGDELCKDVEWIYASVDLSDIYFYSEDKELRYVEGAEKTTKICDDLNDVVITPDKKLFFTVKDTYDTSILYSIDGKKSKVKIENGGEVYSLYRDSGSVYFNSYNDDKEYDIYARESGNKFTCVIKDLER